MYTRLLLSLIPYSFSEPDENENEISEVKIECKFLTTKVAYFTCVGEDQYLIINQETIRPPKMRIKISVSKMLFNLFFVMYLISFLPKVSNLKYFHLVSLPDCAAPYSYFLCSLIISFRFCTFFLSTSFLYFIYFSFCH